MFGIEIRVNDVINSFLSYLYLEIYNTAKAKINYPDVTFDNNDIDKVKADHFYFLIIIRRIYQIYEE